MLGRTLVKLRNHRLVVLVQNLVGIHTLVKEQKLLKVVHNYTVLEVVRLVHNHMVDIRRDGGHYSCKGEELAGSSIDCLPVKRQIQCEKKNGNF